MIDGGAGQVATASAALEELGISGVVLLGLAKGVERRPGMEQVFLSGQQRPFILPPDSPALHLLQQIRDERWVWHVGLDAEGSALLNDLYTGEEVDEARMARLLSLFRLEFLEPRVMRRDVAGRPVYLALAMSEESRLRLKPQNLLVNLPLAEPA